MNTETPIAEEAAAQKIYTVSLLNQAVNQTLAGRFGTVWLQGEISNFSRPASGHYYFTLKDNAAQLRCAMFRSSNRHLSFAPSAGDEVLVRGKPGLYTTRGDFQLIVDLMKPAGAGRLNALYEQIRRELEALGWFDPDHKQAIPAIPASIGIVCSPTGAAVRDVLQVLKRRYPRAQVVLYPTLTQGADAAPMIRAALHQANERKECDVLLLVRGGGSLEDLWAFNEKIVAQAVWESSIPVVSGIGHETDVTISDFVADLRAPTPSAAAELVTPETAHLVQRLQSSRQQMHSIMNYELSKLRLALEQQLGRLQRQHPESVIRERSQRTDELESRLHRLIDNQLERLQAQRLSLSQRLGSNTPERLIAERTSRLLNYRQRLSGGIKQRQDSARARLELLMRALHGVSPLAVLDRGYALVKKDEQVITSASQVAAGDEITARLGHGEITAQVTQIRPTDR